MKQLLLKEIQHLMLGAIIIGLILAFFLSFAGALGKTPQIIVFSILAVWVCWLLGRTLMKEGW